MDNEMKEYYDGMTKKYHIDEESLQNQVFESVSLSSLNTWLSNISTNINISNLNDKILLIKEQIEEIYKIKIKPLEDKIKVIEGNIKNDKTQNKNVERISKITDQAVNQNPDNIVINTKRLLLDGNADIMVNINKISELTDLEKKELHKQFIYEFKVMAGIIQP